MAKIFCIDDSSLVRNEFKKALLDSPHEVVEGHNGRHALEVLNEHPDIKLIFCDVNMPEMNGIDFCENISKMEQYKQIPIIMFTTETRSDLKEKAKGFGVKGWLVKPFTPTKILTVVQKILG